MLADQGIKSYRLNMNHFADMVRSYTDISSHNSLNLSCNSVYYVFMCSVIVFDAWEVDH